MSLKSMIPEITLDHAAEEKKSAARIEPYRISSQALFLPDGRYLPLSAVKKVTAKPSSLQMHGCCGLSLPVTALLFSWEDNQEKPFRIQLEKKENAGKILELIQKNYPSVTVDQQ